MSEIETKIKYDGEVTLLSPFQEISLKGDVFHRTDYHEDGSESEYYGIEISHEIYSKLLRTPAEL
jgi:hypothetical protein